MLAPRTILAAMDFSEASLGALRHAEYLARSFNASVHLLHVVAEPLNNPWASYAPADEVAALLEAAETASRQRLESLVNPADLASGRVVVVTVWGDPSAEILRYALEHHMDLIVCGTHGRRGMSRLALGSVAERVVRLAGCPVMTVRDRDAAEAA